MKLILLGAPGAGKGTQADVIRDRLSIPVLGTGNLIREAVKNGTEAGKTAKGHMDSGGLVPDEIVIDMLRERMKQPDCANGFILDGFPRNVAQAQALEKMGIEIDRVIDIEVPDEKIMSRMAGRRVCADCGTSYHLEYLVPKADGICDKCGGKLIIRADDKPETVKERLRVYHEWTEPLIDHYRSSGKLFMVEGQEKVEDTIRLTIEALEAVV